MEERIKKWIQTSWIELSLFLIYMIITLIYLDGLKKFNQSIRGESYLTILVNPKSSEFLLHAILIAIAGGVLIFIFFTGKVKRNQISHITITEFVLIIFIITLLVFLIYEIQNPILRAFILGIAGISIALGKSAN